MRNLLAAVLAALLLGGCGYSGLGQLPLPGGPDTGKDSYVVTADFSDVLNLARQSTVKADGVTIGRVERIERRGWKARAVLRIRGDVALPAETVAHIGQTSLLGEKFVDLQAPAGPADGPVLKDGSAISIGSTSRGAEVEEVLGALSLLLNGGGVAQLKSISQELHQALDPDTVDAARFLQQLDRFVGTLDRNRTTIIETLENVDALTRTINADRRTVDQALDDLGPGFRVLAGQQEELTSMLGHLDSFSTVASDVVRQSGADLTADLDALRPTLAQLAAAGDSLPQALEVILTFPFPDAVLNAVKGDYVNLDVEIDLSALDILKNVTGGIVDPYILPLPFDDVDEPLLVPGLPAASTTEAPIVPSVDGGLLGLLLGGVR
ncbi:MCE family protein [Aeromicrobium sp. A1-2]|uniref:MCE family protein n=1 Tax=Aeromicrobium sp. A1-2 TaxID=2107713 RepID=UPI0013C37A49|nr:MCE family protein [Aeromicrobium sp. A1-2]